MYFQQKRHKTYYIMLFSLTLTELPMTYRLYNVQKKLSKKINIVELSSIKLHKVVHVSKMVKIMKERNLELR